MISVYHLTFDRCTVHSVQEFLTLNSCSIDYSMLCCYKLVYYTAGENANTILIALHSLDTQFIL